MKEQLISTLAPICISLAGVLGTWILYEVRRWVRARTNNELAFAAIEDISVVVKTVVTELNQTFVAAAEDGVFTPEERAEMKAMAHAMVVAQIPPLIKRNAIRLVNNFDDWVNSRIEREVVKAKYEALFPYEAAPK